MLWLKIDNSLSAVKVCPTFSTTCIACSHSCHRRCPLSESQSCQIREWNCQRWESAGSVGVLKSLDIGGLAPPGSLWSSAQAHGTFGWSHTENPTLLPRNHILGGLLDNLHQQTFAGGRLGSGTIFMPPSQILFTVIFSQMITTEL